MKKKYIMLHAAEDMVTTEVVVMVEDADKVDHSQVPHGQYARNVAAPTVPNTVTLIKSSVEPVDNGATSNDPHCAILTAIRATLATTDTLVNVQHQTVVLVDTDAHHTVVATNLEVQDTDVVYIMQMKTT